MYAPIYSSDGNAETGYQARGSLIRSRSNSGSSIGFLAVDHAVALCGSLGPISGPLGPQYFPACDENTSTYRGCTSGSHVHGQENGGGRRMPIVGGRVISASDTGGMRRGGTSPTSTLTKARQRIQQMISLPRSEDHFESGRRRDISSATRTTDRRSDCFDHVDSVDHIIQPHFLAPSELGCNRIGELQAVAEDDAIIRLESQIDRLVAARTRVRLECSLGASLPELSVLLAGIWRLDHVLWSAGSLLLLSSAVALGKSYNLFARFFPSQDSEAMPTLARYCSH